MSRDLGQGVKTVEAGFSNVLTSIVLNSRVQAVGCLTKDISRIVVIVSSTLASRHSFSMDRNIAFASQYCQIDPLLRCITRSEERFRREGRLEESGRGKLRRPWGSSSAFHIVGQGSLSHRRRAQDGEHQQLTFDQHAARWQFYRERLQWTRTCPFGASAVAPG
jgi:hypothetical protein